MPVAHGDICDFGWKAIDAHLMGVDGQEHRLYDLRGEKGTVIVFMCNHCPYVIAIIDRLVRDAHDLQALAVNVIAISSNDATQYPDDSFDNMRKIAAAHDFPFPYLYDEDQSVAKAYNAICTPDFFGFNDKMALQYRGRLDESRAQTALPNVRRDLFEAMKQVAHTGEGPRTQEISIGCSIKWK